MTALPENPSVAILLNSNDQVVGVASNIAKFPDFEVQVTKDQSEFDQLSLGKMFVVGNTK